MPAVASSDVPAPACQWGRMPGQAGPWAWPEAAFGPTCDFWKAKPQAWAPDFVGIYFDTKSSFQKKGNSTEDALKFYKVSVGL